MATVPKSTKPVKPVSGVCRWARRIGEGGIDPQSGVLVINGQPYGVLVMAGGYRLVKPDGTAYDVNGQTWECDCPDATYRGRQCKHSKALRAALRAAGQP
ncbi:MAG TPA: SWIM zinc finger family protein [Gemmataceae bacterium]|nr:SWIM zinc finger family protein [Gemmataceae bacterium]